MVGWVGIFEHSGMGWDWDGLRIFRHSGMDWGWGWRWIGFGHNGTGWDWDLWTLKDGLGLGSLGTVGQVGDGDGLALGMAGWVGIFEH